MEIKNTRVYALIKRLKIAEDLYKCVCHRANEKPLRTFFWMIAKRKNFYHDEISRYLDLKIEKDYFSIEDDIVNDLNEELEKINVWMEQNDPESMLEYFIQTELSLIKDYTEIMKKNNYDFLTNLI